MSNKFCQLPNLPVLPEHIVADGLTNGFEYTASPFTYAKKAPSFHETIFYKLLEKQFGKENCNCKYLKNSPNSYYEWHTDKIRKCALNYIVNTSSNAKTFYREYTHNKNFFELEEVIYSEQFPTLIDTTHEHCVFNNCPEERVIFTISILNHSYQEVLKFLQSLEISKPY
jgi:hypothetical protein